MCNNECISKGKCEHNEECYDVCFTSEQSKVIEKLIAKAKENERRKFAECLKDRFSQIVVPGCMSFLLSRKTNSIIDQVLEEYEKEQKCK